MRLSRVIRNRGRRRGLRTRGALLLVLLGSAACGDSDLLGPEMSADVEEFVALANAHRETVGCGPLQWLPPVAGVAQAHSDDMVARAYFSHTNPEGQSPFDRLAAAGIGYRRAAENIAWGYPSAPAVLAGWLGSPGHRANLDNCALTHHGVGLSGSHWTHLFVTP